MTEIQIQTKSKFAVLAILFAFSYAILFALTFFSAILSSIPFLNALVPTTSWDSVTHWILPVVGFFGVYFLIEWGKDFFKSKFFASILFPITFLIASLISLFTAILFLYMPASINTGRQIILCAFDCPGLRAFYETSGKGGEIIFFEFWPIWVQSTFIWFVYAGILGWVAYAVIHKLEASNKL